MSGLVPATSPLKSLHKRTGCRGLSHEQFTGSILRNRSQGLAPKLQNWFEFVGLVTGTKLLDSEAKMASDYM